MAATAFDERKTNERPGVRAQHRHARFSAYKAREVLDLIRGKSVMEARTVLEFCNREAAEVVMKVLDSAVANAGNNNDIPPEELFVAACYADEGPTLKRWRPRARGRATRIRKRTCHITVIVGRYSSTELDRIRERLAGKGRTTTDASASRARRVARSRSGSAASPESAADEQVDDAATQAEADESIADQQATEAVVTEESADDTEADSVGVAVDEAATADDAAEAAADVAATDAVVGEDAAETDEKDD